MTHGTEVYQKLLHQHGVGVRALAIESDEVHAARLKLAAFFIEEAHKEWPIKNLFDFGCGFGDLYPWVRTISGIYYQGCDQQYEMEREAVRRYPELHGRINRRLGAFAKFDMVVALGVLSTVSQRCCDEFMRDLLNLSHRYVLVSWIDDEQKLMGHYWGNFNVHSHAQVFGKHTCVRLEVCHGETTALLVKNGKP